MFEGAKVAKVNTLNQDGKTKRRGMTYGKTAKTKKAYLIEKNMPSDKLIEIFRQAEEERKTGVQVNISIMKKNKKFQKEKLTAEGYTDFVEFFNK